MPFARDPSIPVVACPDHRGSTVQACGKRELRGIRFQRYRCRSNGKSGGTHYFLVPLGDRPRLAVARPAWQPPPACPDHPKGRVTRAGHYGRDKAGRIRQRYRCDHGPEHTASCKSGCEGKPHRFTPPLARRWIEGHGFADACDICEQPRGVHRGEANAARHHSFTSLTVARGLIRLSGGDTYGEVSLWALGQRAGVRATRATGTTKPASRARSNNVWHIAADWTEVFAPVLWRPLDERLRTRALVERARLDAERAAGLPLRNPLIWVADELPVTDGKLDVFVVLVVAECEWLDGQAEPLIRLRLARAMPDRTVPSWLLVWDELAGAENLWPDFLVSDRSTALLLTARSRLDPRVRWVPSVWHLAKVIRGVASGIHSTDAPRASWAIEGHLAQLTRGSDALTSVEGWARWWDEIAAIFRAEGVPRSVDTRRRIYEPPFAAVIPDMGGAWIPISNAAIEAIIRTRLRRLFQARGASMTSIERTNALLDLAVARAHGELDDEAAVARRLRDDAHAHDGWAVPPRSINDPADPHDRRRRYRSLRDPALSTRLAYERGLA